MHTRGVAKDTGPIWQHGVPDFGAHRRCGGVIEIDHWRLFSQNAPLEPARNLPEQRMTAGSAALEVGLALLDESIDSFDGVIGGERGPESCLLDRQRFFKW